MARTNAELSRDHIENVIEEATRLLVEAAHPQRIILFGSYARGDYDERSDLDLLLILPYVEDPFSEMDRLEQVLLPLEVPIDLIVCSTGEVRERGHLRGTTLYHALIEGKILHDAA